MEKHTCRLNEKGEHISRHKDLRQPPFPHERVPFAVNKLDDPSQNHVYRRGKQGRRDQQEDRLCDEGTYCPVWGLSAGDGAADIADPLDCGEERGLAGE